MTIPRLGKEAENRLTDALGDVARYVGEDDLSPNEAIIKAASQHDIPAGHIPLMVYGYNIGRSETQRIVGSDGMEKAAEFELADAKTILDKLYPKHVPTKSEQKLATAISEEYDAPPVWLVRPTAEPQEKTASVKSKSLTRAQLLSPTGKVATCSTGQKTALRRAYSQADLLEREVKTKQVDALAHHEKLGTLVQKLGMYFKVFGHRPFPLIKADSERLFGKAASALFNTLVAADNALLKEPDRKRNALAPVNLDEQPYPLITECIKTARACIKIEQELEELTQKAASSTARIMAPHLPEAPTTITRGVIEVPAETKKADAELLGGLLGGYMMGGPGEQVKSMGGGAKDVSDIKSDLLRNKLDPIGQDITIRNADVSAMLSDLMAGDDVLSRHKPSDILQHYNEISELAPRAAANTALVRAMLRKRLEGGAHTVDPYDVDLLLKIENQMKNRDVLGAGAQDKGVLS